MNNLSLLQNCEIARVSALVAAGTSDINSTSVKLDNGEAVAFLVAFGTITSTAVTSIKIQQSSDDGSTDGWSDLEGSAITIPDTASGLIAAVEVVRPTKTWVRAVVDRGTANAVVDGIFAIKGHLRKTPPTFNATVAATKAVFGPAEGTA